MSSPIKPASMKFFVKNGMVKSMELIIIMVIVDWIKYGKKGKVYFFK